MADVSKLTILGDEYELKDAVARSDIETLDDSKVSKSGDTMTGVLIVSDHNITVKKTNADISASTINQSQYAIVGATDKNDRYIGYMQASNDTSGATSIQLSSRKYINNSDVENFVRLLVGASGNKGVVVSDAEAWRNALGAFNGIWPTSVGGTGYADSGWFEITDSEKFNGSISYRRIGQVVTVCARNLYMAVNQTTPSRVLCYIPEGFRPASGGTSQTAMASDFEGEPAMIQINPSNGSVQFRLCQNANWSTTRRIFFSICYLTD